MKIETYTDTAGEKRWRLVAANGKVVASGEGFKGHMHRAIEDSIVQAAVALVTRGIVVESEHGDRKRLRVLIDDKSVVSDESGHLVEWMDEP